MKITNLKKSITLIAMLTFLAGCGKQVTVDPPTTTKDTFYDLARLFMLKQEKELYKRLSDDAEKQEFIKEFWARRDPNPKTPGNEFMVEVKRRIAYANTWFWRTRGSRNRGWDTDRGRIYLILGPPDRVVFQSDLDETGHTTEWEGRRNRISKQWPNETWYYYRYRLPIWFKKSGLNDYRIDGLSQQLVGTLEDIRLQYVNGDRDLQNIPLTLKFAVKDDQILLDIPIEAVEFIQKDRDMAANFSIKIKFYKKNKKMHQIIKERTYKKSADQLLKQETIRITVPMDTALSGRYLIFVEVKDLQSNRTIFERKKISF